MPLHTPEHMRRLTAASASQRRAAKIARLIDSSPPLDRTQVVKLCALLQTRIPGGAR